MLGDQTEQRDIHSLRNTPQKGVEGERVREMDLGS